LHVEVIACHQSWISAYKGNLQNIKKMVITCRRKIKPTLYDKGINPKMTTYFGIIDSIILPPGFDPNISRWLGPTNQTNSITTSLTIVVVVY
jgi:hypothetical protein